MSFFRRRRPPHSFGLQVEEEWPFDASNGFVVLSCETTGLDPDTDRIIDIAMVRTDDFANPLGYWTTLVNPGQPISNSEFHGITDQDVVDAPTFAAIADDVLSRINSQVLVSHNVSFPISFLEKELARAGHQLQKNPTVCTMQESHYFMPALQQRRLEDCMAPFKLEQEVTERALAKATATTTLFNFFVNCGIHPTRSEYLRSLPSRVQKQSA
jgi:DNA polymerase III epsilon subunit family exonuclease